MQRLTDKGVCYCGNRIPQPTQANDAHKCKRCGRAYVSRVTAVTVGGNDSVGYRWHCIMGPS